MFLYLFCASNSRNDFRVHGQPLWKFDIYVSACDWLKINNNYGSQLVNIFALFIFQILHNKRTDEFAAIPIVLLIAISGNPLDGVLCEINKQLKPQLNAMQQRTLF